jgi:hypothetical protein
VHMSMPFRQVLAVQSDGASSTVVARVELTPASNFGTRVAAVYNSFEYFRLRKLKVSCMTDSVPTVVYDTGNIYAISGIHSVGFTSVPTVDTSVATTYTQASQLESFRWGPWNKPLQLVLGGSALRVTPAKWYHTTATGTPPSADSSQGLLQFTLTVNTGLFNTVVQYCVLEGVVEFAVPVAPALAKNEEDRKEPVGPVQDPSRVLLDAPFVVVQPTSLDGVDEPLTRVPSARLRPPPTASGVSLSGVPKPRQ